jgi:hypothetical protein
VPSSRITAADLPIPRSARNLKMTRFSGTLLSRAVATLSQTWYTERSVTAFSRESKIPPMANAEVATFTAIS